MKSIIFLFGCCIFLSLPLRAQRFGGHRASLKWMQVNTTAARVIFPMGLDSTGIRVALVVDQLRAATLPTIGLKLHKINIVLQPYTTISNGYVSLGPFRSEFNLTPPQNSFELGSLPWQDNLAIHEYRHVQQYNNFNVGLSKLFRGLFGEQGQELANAISVPNWFWEGDAVFQETLVSHQGRGRLPFFFNEYSALWWANRNYSYMKLRNGSLLDFTPDHYRLGYMLVAYGREIYGEEFWRMVTHDAASFKGLFYPLQRAVKQYSGKSFSAFHNDAMKYFIQSLSPPRPLSSFPLHFLGDQEFPTISEADATIYVKSSYHQIPTFVENKMGEERKIRTRDVSLDNQFSYRKGKIVYASYRQDIRRSWNDYNELQVVDVRSGKQKTITRHSKYFSPDLSLNGDSIVAVDVQPGGHSHLHILNTNTGAIIKIIPNNENFFYTYPKFINNQQVVTAARMSNGKMVMLLVAIQDGAFEYLTEASYRVIGFPSVQEDTLYFSAADRQCDELLSFTLKDKKLFHLAIPSKGLGAYQPGAGINRIVYTTFTDYGYRLEEVPKNEIGWEEIAAIGPGDTSIAFGIHLSTNKAAGLLSVVKKVPLPVSVYPPTYQLLNFHSLLPYILDPDYTLSFVGQNVLNTLQSELFFSYNRNEQFKQMGFNATYGGWFPYVSLGINYVLDRKDVTRFNQPLYWNETNFAGGLSVPLNLSKGRSIAGINFGADYVFKNVSYKGVYKDSLASSSFGYINSFISFTHQIQKARQHIYPRFAQSIYLNYRNAVSLIEANQFLATGSFYWPGLFVNHNVVITIAYQQRDTLNQYRFSNSFPFSRGFTSPNLRNLLKFGLNYHLPLAYPDWGIGNVVYFLRIRSNFFYDHTVGKVAYRDGRRIKTDFRSAGIEIFFDTKWWNELPLNFGVRYSHLLDPDLFGGSGMERIEFILPVNLFQR